MIEVNKLIKKIEQEAKHAQDSTDLAIIKAHLIKIQTLTEVILDNEDQGKEAPTGQKVILPNQPTLVNERPEELELKKMMGHMYQPTSEKTDEDDEPHTGSLLDF